MGAETQVLPFFQLYAQQGRASTFTPAFPAKHSFSHWLFLEHMSTSEPTATSGGMAWSDWVRVWVL